MKSSSVNSMLRSNTYKFVLQNNHELIQQNAWQ